MNELTAQEVNLNNQTVVYAIVHKLLKDRNAPAEIQLRSNCLQVTPQLHKILVHIKDLYAKQAGKSYGRFEEDLINFPTQRIVREYFALSNKVEVTH